MNERHWSVALVAVSCLLVSGCTPAGLRKHATALSAATAPVVDQAEKAYLDANRIHDLRVDYDAAVEFDDTKQVYNPRKVEPLLSEKDLDVRLAVLKALQCYVKSLVAITSGTDSKALDDASVSLGGSMADVGDTLLPAGSSSQTKIITTNGTSATQTTTVAAGAISADEKHAIVVAANALGQFLVSRKIAKELPARIKEMDPHVQVLCEVLSKDIDILKDREKMDFDFMINQQTLFLREKTTMDVEVRREQIMKLPEIARQQKAADEQLDQLKGAIGKLAQTHHAAAQDNNPESVKDKLGELAKAGDNLGKLYSTVSSSASK